MLKNMRVLIVGGGIGGLAAARALALRGADVTLLEQAEALREVGAGLQVSPNGARVLEALGLGEALGAQSVETAAVSLRDYRRGEVVRLDLARLEARGYHCVHRADLIALLEAGARDAGVDIRLGQAVRAITDGVVTLADGREMTADLVVAADGVRSLGRAALNGAAEPFFTRHVAWRATVPGAGLRGREVWVHMAPRRHLVSYPLRGGKLMNLVAVQERASWAEESWATRGDPDEMRHVFADFGPEAQALLGQVNEAGFWGLFRHEVAPRWHGARLALLGDAAHPTLPFMAQGAVMALEDAWVLADCLAKEGLPRGLAAYQGRREARVRRVVDAATGNARKYHLSFGPLRSAAHLALRLGGAVAPGRMIGQFDWLYGADVTL